MTLLKKKKNIRELFCSEKPNSRYYLTAILSSPSLSFTNLNFSEQPVETKTSFDII